MSALDQPPTNPMNRPASQPQRVYGRPAVLRPINELRSALVDGLFREGQIHLLAGPSGVGKTRWGVEMLDRISRGEKILGHQSHPTDFVYVAADRDYDTARLLLSDLGMDPSVFPIFSLLEDKELQAKSFDQILNKYILPQFPNAKLIFVEALTMLVPGGKIVDYAVVKKFLHMLLDTCHRHGLTIIGTGHTPKVKKDEGYELTRENILGTVAWGGVSDTVVNFEFAKRGDPTDPRRRVVVWPHSFGKTEVFHMAFQDNGRLCEVENPGIAKVREEKQSSKLLTQFLADEAGKKFTSAIVIEYFESAGGSRASAMRALSAMVKVGHVEKLKHGTFKAIERDLLDVTPLDV